MRPSPLNLEEVLRAQACPAFPLPALGDGKTLGPSSPGPGSRPHKGGFSPQETRDRALGEPLGPGQALGSQSSCRGRFSTLAP